jgi:hypothetical protein
MAKEILVKGRKYWILSEPRDAGWCSRVVQVRDDGSSEDVGIDATAETRGAADEAAERKLQRLLQA